MPHVAFTLLVVRSIDACSRCSGAGVCCAKTNMLSMLRGSQAAPTATSNTAPIETTTFLMW